MSSKAINRRTGSQRKLSETDPPSLESQGVLGFVSSRDSDDSTQNQHQNMTMKNSHDVEEVWNALGEHQGITREDLRQWIEMPIRKVGISCTLEDLVLQHSHYEASGKDEQCEMCRKQRILNFVLWFKTKREELARMSTNLERSSPTWATSTPKSKPTSTSAGQLLDFLKPLGPILCVYVFRALYCVSMAWRPLTTAELFAAVMTDVDGTIRTGMSESQPTDTQSLMTLCNGLLIIKSSDEVHFACPSLRDYLSGSKVGEFRNGHTLMAKICLKHLSNRPASVLRPWDDFGIALSEQSKHPFLRYVICFWDLHYKFAESKSPELPRDLFQLIGLACESACNDDQVLRRSIDVGFELCKVAGFKILETTYVQMGAILVTRQRQIFLSADGTRSQANFNIKLIEPCSSRFKDFCSAPLFCFPCLDLDLEQPQDFQHCDSCQSITELTFCSERSNRDNWDNSSDSMDCTTSDNAQAGYQYNSCEIMDSRFSKAVHKSSKEAGQAKILGSATQDLSQFGSWTSSPKASAKSRPWNALNDFISTSETDKEMLYVKFYPLRRGRRKRDIVD